MSNTSTRWTSTNLTNQHHVDRTHLTNQHKVGRINSTKQHKVDMTKLKNKHQVDRKHLTNQHQVFINRVEPNTRCRQETQTQGVHEEHDTPTPG